MMTKTHGMTGLAVWLAGDTITRTAGAGHPYYVTASGAILAYLAAQAPDIDHPNSRPGRCVSNLFPGLPDAIEATLGHRGITHWAITGVVTGLLFGLVASILHPSLWFIGLAVATGWVTHIAGDCCTYQGAPALGPFNRTPVRLPYGYRIECGGQIETRIVYPTMVGLATVAGVGAVALAVSH